MESLQLCRDAASLEVDAADPVGAEVSLDLSLSGLARFADPVALQDGVVDPTVRGEKGDSFVQQLEPEVVREVVDQVGLDEGRVGFVQVGAGFAGCDPGWLAAARPGDLLGSNGSDRDADGILDQSGCCRELYLERPRRHADVYAECESHGFDDVHRDHRDRRH